MHRLFVAIRPPEEIRDLLIDAMADSPELRWVSDDNLHLTLRFVGEVERPLADDIALALSRLRSGSLVRSRPVPPFRIYDQRQPGELLILRVYHQTRRPIVR